MHIISCYSKVRNKGWSVYVRFSRLENFQKATFWEPFHPCIPYVSTKEVFLKRTVEEYYGSMSSPIWKDINTVCEFRGDRLFIINEKAKLYREYKIQKVSS